MYYSRKFNSPFNKRWIVWLRFLWETQHLLEWHNPQNKNNKIEGFGGKIIVFNKTLHIHLTLSPTCLSLTVKPKEEPLAFILSISSARISRAVSGSKLYPNTGWHWITTINSRKHSSMFKVNFKKSQVKQKSPIKINVWLMNMQIVNVTNYCVLLSNTTGSETISKFRWLRLTVGLKQKT